MTQKTPILALRNLGEVGRPGWEFPSGIAKEPMHKNFVSLREIWRSQTDKCCLVVKEA